jgi:hypothetical protein
LHAGGHRFDPVHLHQMNLIWGFEQKTEAKESCFPRRKVPRHGVVPFTSIRFGTKLKARS